MVTFLGNTFRFTRALSYKPFALLWTGQAISRLGDGAYTTAMAWQILLLTGSATAMGVVLVASTIPMIAFLLIGGVVADRIPKRLILICSDASRAVSVLVIAALSFFHQLHLWELSEAQTSTSVSRPKYGIRKVVTDLHEGLMYVLRSPWLWITISVSALGNIGLLGPLQVALPKLVYNVYGVGVWLLGTVTTTNAVGSLLGTFLIGQMPDVRRRGLLAYLGLILSNIGIITFGLPLPKLVEPLAACIGSALVGFGLSVFGVIWITILQTLVPNEKLGRVFSIDALGSYCLLPVGYLLAGTLTDRIGPAQVFILGGVFDLVLISLALGVREIRQME
jgi:MFS family permease